MFSERDVWVQHVRRQELEEAAHGYRFAKQFNIPDNSSKCPNVDSHLSLEFVL